MTLPTLDSLRRTRIWQALRDWRYLRGHRSRLEFYRQFIRPGALVFDIGANVGHYTLLFDRLQARVIAVEPQSALAAALRKRFAGWKRVRIVQTALGAAPASAVLHKTPGLTEVASLRADVGERSRFAADHLFSEEETVPVCTLDSIIAAHGRPDFCKIDVEGFEHEVLAGLRQALPLMSLEFNREFWPEIEKCLARLGELGTYRFNYALGEATSLALETWIDAGSLSRELQSNPDPLLWGDLYARLD